MKNLTLHKIKKGMTFDECLVAICDGVIGLVALLPGVCEKAASILGGGHTPYTILSMLDAMEIYGDDLTYLYAECENDGLNLITIVWAVEVGANESKLGKEIPEFAEVETIKQMITDLRSRKEVNYPFDEAKKFIEENSLVRFPVSESKKVEQKKNGLLLFARNLIMRIQKKIAA